MLNALKNPFEKINIHPPEVAKRELFLWCTCTSCCSLLNFCSTLFVVVVKEVSSFGIWAFLVEYCLSLFTQFLLKLKNQWVIIKEERRKRIIGNIYDLYVEIKETGNVCIFISHILLLLLLYKLCVQSMFLDLYTCVYTIHIYHLPFNKTNNLQHDLWSRLSYLAY